MVYLDPAQHEVTMPRRGDLAEIRRSHCIQESGRLIQVMGDPHLAVARCSHCGIKVEELLVEVHCSDPEWQTTPGPWFWPIGWLKRLDPLDPVQYARIRKYAYITADDEQMKAANA